MNIEVVKDYYGKVLKSSGDLKTSACCNGSDLPAHLKPLLANVHEESDRNIMAAAWWCRPRSKEPGCSTSVGLRPRRLSHRPAVGASGEAVGVDMTDEQLATAQSHIDWHAQRFGYGSGSSPRAST